MSSPREPYDRWAPDALHPTAASSPPSYSARADGPIRRAALHDHAGQLLGRVWTDDRDAAGFVPEPTPAGTAAASFVFVILTECARRDVPASELLDPALYAPDYVLNA